MESLHPLYIGVSKAGVGKCESRVRVYRLFEQIDRLLILLLLVKLVESPTTQVEIVGRDIFGRFLVDIGPLVRRQSCFQCSRYLFGDIALNSENVLYLPVVGGTPEALVRGGVI